VDGSAGELMMRLRFRAGTGWLRVVVNAFEGFETAIDKTLAVSVNFQERMFGKAGMGTSASTAYGNPKYHRLPLPDSAPDETSSLSGLDHRRDHKTLAALVFIVRNESPCL
jgi:hypothetical protein